MEHPLLTSPRRRRASRTVKEQWPANEGSLPPQGQGQDEGIKRYSARRCATWAGSFDVGHPWPPPLGQPTAVPIHSRRIGPCRATRKRTKGDVQGCTSTAERTMRESGAARPTTCPLARVPCAPRPNGRCATRATAFGVTRSDSARFSPFGLRCSAAARGSKRRLHPVF